MENAELALEHGVDISLRYVVTRGNFGGIREFIDDLARRGFLKKEEERKAGAVQPDGKRRGEFGFGFNAVSNAKDPISVWEIQNALREYGFSVEEALDHNSHFASVAGMLNKAMEEKSFPAFSASFCGAEKAEPIFDPYGRVFTCWEAVGKDEDEAGFWSGEAGRIFWNFNKAKWLVRTADRMDKCKTCPYVFVCRGGCAARAKFEKGDYFTHHCGDRKEVFDYAASWYAGKLWREKGETQPLHSLLCSLSRLSEEQREMIMNSDDRNEIFRTIAGTGLYESVLNGGKKPE